MGEETDGQRRSSGRDSVDGEGVNKTNYLHSSSSTNKTLAMYKSGASSATKTTLPATNNVQGGVLASPSSATTSTSTTSATAKGEVSSRMISLLGVASALLASLLVTLS